MQIQILLKSDYKIDDAYFGLIAIIFCKLSYAIIVIYMCIRFNIHVLLFAYILFQVMEVQTPPGLLFPPKL